MSRWVWRWQKRTGSPQRSPQPPPPPQGTLLAVYRKNKHSTLHLIPPQHCIGSPPSCPDLCHPPTKICCTEASTQPDPKKSIILYWLKPKPLTWQRNSTSSPSTNVVISGKLCRKRGGAEIKSAQLFSLIDKNLWLQGEYCQFGLPLGSSLPHMNSCLHQPSLTESNSEWKRSLPMLLHPWG